jgi:PAS domain S-box-containing protein
MCHVDSTLSRRRAPTNRVRLTFDRGERLNAAEAESTVARDACPLAGRRLDRDRRLHLPDSLIDLAGLNIGAEDFLAAVLETAAQPIWVVDPDGVIRFANPAAIAALGYDYAVELLGRPSHETIHYRHPDGTPYPGADCPMLLPRASGETVASELDWFFRRDGSMLPVSYVSVPIQMPEGRGAVVAFTDIEDRLRADGCCASATRPLRRNRRRCDASRRWWPAERRRRTCSQRSPGRSAT